MNHAQAQRGTSLKEKLTAYTWKKRVLLVIAASANDTHFQKQQDILANQAAGLQDRDMEVVYLPLSKIPQPDTDFLMQQFNIKPDRFYAILIGKDGTGKLQATTPLTTEQLFGTIDAMPMRKQEMRNK